MPLSARHYVMHPDCNATKNLFGGKLLAWFDEAAAMYARCQAETTHVVTAHFGALDFIKPVPLGSVVEIYCDKIKQGNTSMVIKVEAYLRKFEENTKELVAKNEVVFVVVDENGKPRPIEK